MIELRNLERSYKTGPTETFVLRRVNLHIAAGEFVTVMGPSGAGKSSLLNTLAMLDDGWRGEFGFDGTAVHCVESQAARGTGAAADRHGVSELSLTRRSDGCGEYRLTVELQEYLARGAAGDGGGYSGSLSDCGQEGPVPVAAERRAAAACGHSARGDSQARAAAGGRADGQPAQRAGGGDHADVSGTERGRHDDCAGDACRGERGVWHAHAGAARRLADVRFRPP